jgi:hypothetical protein
MNGAFSLSDQGSCPAEIVMRANRLHHDRGRQNENDLQQGLGIEDLGHDAPRDIHSCPCRPNFWQYN